MRRRSEHGIPTSIKSAEEARVLQIRLDDTRIQASERTLKLNESRRALISLIEDIKEAEITLNKNAQKLSTLHSEAGLIRKTLHENGYCKFNHLYSLSFFLTHPSFLIATVPQVVRSDEIGERTEVWDSDLKDGTDVEDGGMDIRKSCSLFHVSISCHNLPIC